MLFGFFLPGLYPLKRLAFLRLTIFFANRFFKYKNDFVLFLITSAIDIAFGTFSSSPGSFIYSFFFIGIILATNSIRPKYLMILALAGGQIVLAYFQETYFTPLGILFNFILSFLFEFLYPLLFLFFSLQLYPLLEYFLSLYYKLIKGMALFSITTPLCFPSGELISAIVIATWSVNQNHKIKFLKPLLITLLLLTHSENLENLQGIKLNLRKINYSPIDTLVYPIPKESDLKKVKQSKKFGTKIFYFRSEEVTRSCYLSISSKINYYLISCRQRNKKNRPEE